MSYRYSFCVFLVLLFNYSYAQEPPCRKMIDTPYRTWVFKLPLANIFDPFCPNLIGGAEYRLSKHSAFQLLAGFSTNLGIQDETSSPKINGYRAKGEYRWYFRLRNRISYYFAADLFYTKYSVGRRDSFVSQATGDGYMDRYRIRTEMYGSDIKWGFQKYLKHHLLIEAFAGLGYKQNNITQYGRRASTDPAAPVTPPVDFNIHTGIPGLGSYVSLNVPINFSIGYVFP